MLILSRLKSGKYKKLFISEKKLLKLFLQTVESSFDHTIEVFMTKPEKILLNVQKRSSKQFYSQKKKYFLRKVSSGHGEIFLTNSESFSLKVEKHEQNIIFQKKFIWWKISSGHVQCISVNPVKKLRQRAKKLALNVRKRSETI